MPYIRNDYSDLTYQLLSDPMFHAPIQEHNGYGNGINPAFEDEIVNIRFSLEAYSHLVEHRAF